MQCKATGLPIPTITWHRSFGSLPKGKTTVADGNLTIRNIAKADSGDYACLAKNFLGQDFAVAQVTVFERLAFILTPPLKVTVLQSSNLQLNCSAQGNTEITWKRTGKVLLVITLFGPMEICSSGTWLQTMREHILRWSRTHCVLLRQLLLLK